MSAKRSKNHFQKRAVSGTVQTLAVVFGDQLDHKAAALCGLDKHRDAVLMIIDDLANTQELHSEMERAVGALSPANLVCTEPGEWRVLRLIEQLAENTHLPLEVLPDSHFLVSREEFSEWMSGRRQRDLVLRNLNPANIVLLPFTSLETIDIAANYYNQNVFKQHTYADLTARGTRPFVVVNSTDMARTKQLKFIQEDFDLLGSDLQRLPVSYAAAASSAYPVLFDPMRLK